MGEQGRLGKFERRNGVIGIERKKLKPVEHVVAMGSNGKTGGSVAELLAGMDLSVVRELSLRSKRLTHLSEELGLCLGNLTKLDLSNNKLVDLPHSLQRLTHLTNLIVNQNCLTTLPLTITQISSLRVLQLAGNKIESLPNNLGDLRCLEILNLSSNLLTELPESCHNLNRLKNLDLSNNAFKSLPSCLTRGMRSLETLDVSANFYINIATAPATKKLKRLYVRCAGKNVKFPSWVLRGRAPDLQVLDCSGTKFKPYVHPDNCQSLKLRILSLESCCVYDRFAQDITSLTDDLESLRLGNIESSNYRNCFWTMPISNLKRPTLLTEITVRGTGLSNVCKEIGNFVNLVKIDLGCNIIYWLPDEICLLSKLEVLLVDGNHLSSLPQDIGRVTNLKELKANGNSLTTLPESIRDLKHLLYLDLYDNEFSEVPEELMYIESLLGVDIDENNFDTNDLCIRDLQYVSLRSVIRDLYQSPDNQRTIGPRYESDIEEPIDASSDISSISCDEQNSTVDSSENCPIDEENWDVSDNSAEEFDPTCERNEPARQQTFSFVSALLQKFAFCPADWHSLPVRQQVALKRQKGEIRDQICVEEGQFDDA